MAQTPGIGLFITIIGLKNAGIPLGVTKLSSFDLNLANKFRDFGEVSLFKLDVAGLFEGKSVTEAVFIIIMLVLSFSLVNMFDSMGTLMGAGRQSGLITYCLLKVFTNKAKDVEVLTSVIAVVFVFRYAFMTLG